MRLAINALSLDCRMGGGWTFGSNLARALANHSPEHEVILIAGDHNLDSLNTLGCEVISAGEGLNHPVRRILAEHTRLPALIKKLEADSFVSLDGTLSPWIKTPALSVFQNLIYFHLAATRSHAQPHVGWYPWLQAQYFRAHWRYAAYASAACVCVSEATRKEFSRHYPRLERNAVTIYEGVDPQFGPVSEADCDHPFILAVGTLYPHKRVERLIELIADPNAPRSLRLKVVGDDWNGQRQWLTSYARQRGVEQRVAFLDAVEKSELNQYYSEALCLGMLSEVESFGLPIAEAMACGTPAIVRGGGAPEEVAGDAGHVATDGSLYSCVKFVNQLLSDKNSRRAYRERALNRSKVFCWETVAQQYWSQIEQITHTRNTSKKASTSGAASGDRMERVYRRLPVALQTMAVNLQGRQNRSQRMGAEFKAELKLLEASEMYSAGELVQLQEERLQSLVQTAYAEVPYYRAQWQKLSITPDDIRSAEDLKKLPVLEKREVAVAGERMVNQSLPPKARIAGHTSGSTGASLQLVYDKAALASEFATVWRLRRRFGCDVDQWHATFAGRLVVPVSQAQPPFHRNNAAQKQTLFSLYHLRRETAEAYSRALSQKKYTYFSGYPSALEALITATQLAGIDLPGPERALFTSSESLLKWQQQHLETALRVPVYDRYGCAEFCVSFTVCSNGRYHLDEEFAIVELDVFEEDDETVTGELLCTGLTNRAMPFIRYRVGDVVTMAKSPCSCGRASQSATAIEGRKEDYVLTPSGVRLGRLDHLFKDLPAIRESQILQQEAGRIQIRIVRGVEYGSSDEQSLLHECKIRMGSEMSVDLEYVDGIERNSAGKFRAVVNTLQEAQRYGG